MKTIFIIDSNTIDFKYLKIWQRELEDAISDYILQNGLNCKVSTIYGTELNGLSLINDSPLTFKSIIDHQAFCTNQFTELFSTGKVRDNDIFVFMDAWNPAIFQLKYLSVAYQKQIYIHGFWQNGSFNKTHYLYWSQKRTWLKNIERALVSAIDNNYFDNEYHFNMIRSSHFKTLGMKNMINAQDKISFAGPPMERAVEYANEFKDVPKRNMIVFPDRAKESNQLIIFKELQRALPQYEWIVVHERALNEEQYYGTLAAAKYIFSADQIDSSTTSAYEAIINKCIPIVPDRLNFTHIVPDKWRYPSEWTKDYSTYTLHYNDLIEYIKDRMENYDKYSEGIEDIGKELTNKYYNISAFKDMIYKYLKKPIVV